MMRKGVVPERIDFDGFANARRHHPIAHLRIHPGQLHAGNSGLEQTIRRSTPIP
jgi:hypothetical protein